MTFFDIQSIDPKSPAEGVEMPIITGEKMTLSSGTTLELGNLSLNNQSIQFIQTLDQALRGAS